MDSRASFDSILKFIIVGAKKSGKSSLMKRFVRDEFIDQILPTIGCDFAFPRILIDEKKIKLKIWDLADNNLVDFYTKGSHIALIVVDLTNKESISQARDFYERISKQKNSPKILLVGNKCDLADKEIYEQTIELGKELKVEVMFVSAKTGANVDKLFLESAAHIVNEIEDPKNPRAILIRDLKRYIDDIARNKVKHNSNLIDFSCGFWHHANSRAINRQANYLLANNLYDKLMNTSKPIESIFSDIKIQRDKIIKDNQLDAREDFVDRGINSTTLNKILNKASLGR